MAAAPTATGSKRKGTHLSILQKLEIIDEKKKGHSVKSLKLHFDAKFKTTIGVQTIRDLIKQEDKLREQCRNISNPKAKTVRKMKTGDVDIATYTWFKTQRAKGLPVSGGMLQLKAQQFNTLMNPGSEFTASKGWLFKFQKRHGIRELSIVGEQNSADVDGANRYLDEIAQLIDENDISLDALYNMDETGLYYLRLPTTTLAAGPEKHVFGFQTNKKRVTIAVCANATGSHRLPLLVIGQFKNPRCLNKVNRDILPCDYTHQSKSWMTSRLFTIWFNETFVPHVTRNLKKQRLPIKALLLLDNASSHDYLEIGDIKCIFLPANVTSLIQPCDQGLIYSLKRRYRRTWMIEMINKLDTDEDGYISEKIKEWTLLDMIKVIGKEWNDLPVSTLQRCWNKILVKCKSQEADLIEASDSAQEVNEVEQMNTGLARLNIDLESWEEEENHLAIEDELTEDDIIRIATGQQDDADEENAQDQVDIEFGESAREPLSMNFGDQAAFWDKASNLLEESDYATREGLLMCLSFAQTARRKDMEERRTRKQPKLTHYFGPKE